MNDDDYYHLMQSVFSPFKPQLTATRREHLESIMPRKLFQMALECPYDEHHIKQLNLGITDLVIQEDDRRSIDLIVVVDKQSIADPKFEIGEDHQKAIFFSINPHEMQCINRAPGLFEIDDVGFFGLEYGIRGYHLYTESVPNGVATLIDRLFAIFPGFLNHVHVNLNERPNAEILRSLQNSDQIENAQELTIMNNMKEDFRNILMRSMKDVKKVNMGKECEYVPINSLSIKHLKIEGGDRIPTNQFEYLNYETIEITNCTPDSDMIREFVEEWKTGDKIGFKRLSVQFKKDMKRKELKELKEFMGGTRRNKIRCDKNRYVGSGSSQLDLNFGFDIRHVDFTATYILTRSKFHFISWYVAQEDNYSDIEDDE